MVINSSAIAVLLGTFAIMIFLRFHVAYAVALSSIACLMYQGLPLSTISQQMIKGIVFLVFVALTIDRKALKVIK